MNKTGKSKIIFMTHLTFCRVAVMQFSKAATLAFRPPPLSKSEKKDRKVVVRRVANEILKL